MLGHILSSETKSRLTFQTIALTLLIAFSLGGVAYYYLQVQQSKHQQLATEKALALWSEDYRSALFFHEELANFILDELSSDKAITAGFAALSLAEEGEKAQERVRLQEASAPIYARMKARGLKQLHFHSRESVSLLRMHQPDRFGDSLIGLRKTVELANATKKTVSGFEEGRIFNGYRYVHPIEWEGTHIGTVETSFSSDAIIEHMIHFNPNRSYVFALRKSDGDKPLFEKMELGYGEFSLSDEYLVERNAWVADRSLLDQFPEEAQPEVRAKLRRTLQKYEHSNASHLMADNAIDVIEQSGRHYLFFHLHVFDIREKEVGALFGLSPADEIDAIMAEYDSLHAYTWLICGILSLSFGTTSFFWRARNESTRLAEAHLQTERMRAKEMFDKSESVQWIIHPGSGRFVDVNDAACETYGYSKDQFLLLEVADINVMDDEVMFAEMRAVERGEQKYFNFRHRLASGEVRDVEVYATNTHIDEQSYIYSIVHDVTEKKRTEEELKEVNSNLVRQTDYANEMVVIAEEAIRTKSAFLATMSHEIRTPLNAVIGMAALLEKSNLDESQKDFARTIVSSSDGLLSLINDILDYSKVEAGKMELEAAPFELCDTINTTLDILSVKAAEKGIALTYMIDAHAPAILVGDSARIRQVILNLLSNAVKFTDVGEVSLRVRAQAIGLKKWRLSFAVSDSGMGMDTATCSILFKPFSQADSSINRKYGGTGLGLAISQRIVEAMGGEIKVESQVNEGSTFHFTVEFAVLSESVKVFHLPEGEDLRDTSVLLVESNATDQHLLKSILSGWGMAVTVMDALPALSELAEAKCSYELAFVDYATLQSDSAAVVRKLQSMGMARHWILLGGPSELETTFSADLRFADSIRKPLRPQRLQNICKRMIGSGQSGVKEDRTSPDEKIERIPNLRVLVADDNLVNQKVLGAMLKAQGHMVETASNGQEAFEKVSGEAYDIVFMDVQMPVMDGLAATQKIKEILPAAQLPVIVALTANAMEGDREKCLAAGMDDYVSKPVRPPELKKCIDRHFSEPAVRASGSNSAENVQDLLDLAYLSELTQTLDSDSKQRFVDELLIEIKAMHATFMESLTGACAKEDITDIHNCLHAFKSATCSLGFKRLAAHLDEMEIQAQQSSFSVSSEVTVGIDLIFAESVKALNQW